MLERDPEEDSRGDLFLHRIEKSGRNAWSRQITVGRAANNDLVLRHASVSKLHAHFSLRGEGGAEVFLLADDGSANGTSVNGRDLARGEEAAVTVSPGDQLRFGEVEGTLLDPLGLHRELRRAERAPRDF
jgi:pSer/pThr/pTyr-binding forkhead associated (FHA) protein